MKVTRNRFLALWGLNLLLFSGSWTVVSAQTAAKQRPNILLIFSDDQGMADIGSYGSEIPTPNIDRIGKEGVQFNSWYVASSLCTPSRFGLLTGRYPSRSKDRLLGALMFLEERDSKRGLQPGETTIAEVLGNNGYRTALIGKWHLGHGKKEFLPVYHGFQSFYGHTGGCVDYFTLSYGIQPDWYRNDRLANPSGYATDVITDEAVRFLSQQTHEQPFFLYLAYNAPHFGKGWDINGQQVVNIMQPTASSLKGLDWIRDPIRREFAAMVISLDQGIGKVLKSLDEKGLAENTLVIFITDNGGDPNYGGRNAPYRGGKATLFEGGIRVPCLMRWPGRIRPGTIEEAPAGSVDLFPTLCRAVGADTGDTDLDGQDLTPLLEGSAAPSEREFFFELVNASALRVGKWKLLSIRGSEPLLFDLEKDPYEETDLSSVEPDTFARMKARHDELLAETKGNGS